MGSAARLFDPDVPEAGFYKMRLRRGGVPVGVRIFYGQTKDPATGEPIERWAWQAEINGEPVEVARVWPTCAPQPVAKAEYHYLTGLQDWGRRHDPDGPQANPMRRVDLLRAPLPF
jgi:hypothetical protein